LNGFQKKEIIQKYKNQLLIWKELSFFQSTILICGTLMTDFNIFNDLFPYGEDPEPGSPKCLRERICEFVEAIEEGIQQKSPACCIAFKASFLNTMADICPVAYYGVMEPWFNRQSNLNRHICFKCWFLNSKKPASKDLVVFDRSNSQLLRSILWLF
jgi:hypothetical protein